MQVTILALGSQGDVRPYLTLGKALKAVGHRVRVATFQNFQSLVAAHGLDYHPVRGDVQDLLSASGGQALAASGRNPLRMARAVLRLFGTLAESFAQDLYATALWDTDLIVNQLPGGMYGCDLAEKLNVPLVSVAVMPLMPTRHEPMLAFPSALSGLPGYNALTHWLAYQLVWQGYRPAVNRWRRCALGLSRAPLWGYTRWMEERRVPVLNGFSPQVVPRPPDWDENVHVTGYWFPEELDWQPPEGLRAFLDAGPPPVFIGFGSMPVRDPERTTAMVLDALAQSGQRAILHTGWGGLGGQAVPESVLPIAYAPYGWLFPRMAAVVHHGGAGTTGFGLRAGVPSIVVPFLFDQFYWGRRVHELGVGPAPIPHKRLSAHRLAEAIADAVSDAEMRCRAAELGGRIRAENGVESAIRIIQQVSSANGS
jgi:UDP:flavonoid glycosyltransferase YjiC (YdhE family)